MPAVIKPDVGRALLTPVFATLMVLNFLQLLDERERSLLSLLGTLAALSFYAVLTVMYLRRGRATSTDRRPEVWIAAGAATFAPFLIPLSGDGGAAPRTEAVGSLLIAVGISLSIWALLHLRTNISVVPQSRQLSTSGPYRVFRHPLYVFEYVSALGLVLLAGGGWAWLVLAALGVLQVLRAKWEEELLHEQLPGYAEYRAYTPGFGGS